MATAGKSVSINGATFNKGIYCSNFYICSTCLKFYLFSTKPTVAKPLGSY